MNAPEGEIDRSRKLGAGFGDGGGRGDQELGGEGEEGMRIWGGDLRAGLRATLFANSFLESEVGRLAEAISRIRARTYSQTAEAGEELELRFAGVAVRRRTIFRSGRRSG